MEYYLQRGGPMTLTEPASRARRNHGIAAAFLTTIGVLLVSLSSVYGQTITTGDLTGTVADATGGVIPNATLTLKSLDTGESKTDQSNGQGGVPVQFSQTRQISALGASARVCIRTSARLV